MKRGLDILGAVLLLVVLSPLLALVAVGVRLSSPGPVLYRQRRRGRGASEFVLLKFRTMGVDADARLPELLHLNLHSHHGDTRMYKLTDDPRVTPWGRFLRRHSLDELPQLLNVLRGEMSLVGPRPLMLEEDAHIGPAGAMRRTVRPGLTGLWQISGRNALSFEEMVALDCAYASTRTLLGDLRILLRTIPTVLRAQAPC